VLIGPTDRVSLADGIVVADALLVDPVRVGPIPLNATGAIVAAQADGRTLAEVAAGLAAATGAAEERALADTIAFCAELNRRLLLNVRRSPRRGALLALHGLRPAFLPRRGGLVTLAAPAALAGTIGALAALPLAVLAGEPLLAALAGAALAAGLVTHETGHAAALLGVPWCLAVAGLRVAILHRRLPPGRRSAVAAAGPAVASLAGVLLLLVAWLLAAEAAALVSAPLVTQALGLTVLAGDGRAACGLS
jgi:hypothetical protein